MLNKDPNDYDINNYKDFGKYTIIKEIFENCIRRNPDERMKIDEIIEIFFKQYYSLIQIEIRYLYLEYKRSINDPQIQYDIGLIYSNGEYVPMNIEKANQCFLQAANQNHREAQYKIGMNYFKLKDFNKTVHYLALAANQNHIEAQYFLGMMYLYDCFVSKNINLAFHYLTLAANQNHQNAQLSFEIE